MADLLRPVTTSVRSRAAGPRTSRAATAMASLAVDAGANAAEASRATSTCPVDRSATMAARSGPNTAESSPGASAARTPAAVRAPRLAGEGELPGEAPDELPPAAPPSARPGPGAPGTAARTGPGAASERCATVGSRNKASRAGSRSATADPALMVNRLSRASDSHAARASPAHWRTSSLQSRARG